MGRKTEKDMADFNSFPIGRLFSRLILNYLLLSLREGKTTSHFSLVPLGKKIHEATQNGHGNKYLLLEGCRYRCL